MPLLASAYVPPLLFRSGHLQTVYPALFRAVDGVVYRRERIETPAGDFLDLDAVETGADRVAILSHGLEGYAGRSYTRVGNYITGYRGIDLHHPPVFPGKESPCVVRFYAQRTAGAFCRLCASLVGHSEPYGGLS